MRDITRHISFFWCRRERTTMANKYLPFLLLLVVDWCLLPFPIYTRFGDAMVLGSSKECHENLELKEADCGDRGLDVVPQSLSEDIVRLDLKKNNIASLSNSAFKKYPQITHLDLSKNDIRMIAPTAFHPLKNLVNLDISANHHLVLPDTGLLRWASKLSTLHLNDSNLRWFPNDALKWISCPLSLNLQDNKLSSINITSCGVTREAILSSNRFEHLNADSFNFACVAETLYLQGNPIKSVDPDVIASLHVRALILGGNFLTVEVLRNIFIGISRSRIEELKITYAGLNLSLGECFGLLRNHYLSVLDFSHNNLTGLYRHVLSDPTQINELNLAHNSIEIIEPEFFEGMQELRVLNADCNRLKDINPNNHTWAVDLHELHLSSNILTRILQYTFLGLRNLTLLDLSSNKGLAVFEATSFSGLHKIETIDLQDCGVIDSLQLDTPTLKSLFLHLSTPALEPGESLTQVKLLEHLDMEDCKLLSLDLWDETYNVSLFDGLLHLKTLHMSYNFMLITYEEDGIFRQLSALQELYLDFCVLISIPRLLFAPLKSLQRLSLKGNLVVRLHPDLLKGLGRLISIDLTANLISHLDEAIFSNNKRLKKIYLSSNKLTSLNETCFTPVKSSLSFIDLSMNPLNCQCDMEWLITWLRGQVHLIDKNSTVCSLASMAPLREKPLLDFDIDVLCRTSILPACLIPLVVICLIVIVVLVYHNRWPLKYKFFLLKLAILGYKEIRDARDHNDYEFDLNIIFYDDNEEWVREHLRPAIAEHLPQFQRNVFGDEDLVLGMHYLDSVDYVVSHSYKTVILLSRAAVRDRWFMLKLRIAMDHVSDTQTEFVVVVFLEDIPDEEIPFLARLYLSDGRPYIYWPEDVRGHEYFWNQLVKNLTINLRTNDLIPNE